jgi:hypothetical protein
MNATHLVPSFGWDVVKNDVLTNDAFRSIQNDDIIFLWMGLFCKIMF